MRSDGWVFEVPNANRRIGGRDRCRAVHGLRRRMDEAALRGHPCRGRQGSHLNLRRDRPSLLLARCCWRGPRRWGIRSASQLRSFLAATHGGHLLLKIVNPVRSRRALDQAARAGKRRRKEPATAPANLENAESRKAPLVPRSKGSSN